MTLVVYYEANEMVSLFLDFFVRTLYRAGPRSYYVAPSGELRAGESSNPVGHKPIHFNSRQHATPPPKQFISIHYKRLASAFKY
jgi:hypothetical protein